jgi:electron transfer flavoprotein alpha subunit
MEWPEAEGILIVAEVEGDSLSLLSRQLMGKGRELADSLGAHLLALWIGEKVGDHAHELIALGADRVLVAEHDKSPRCDIITHTHILGNVIDRKRPEIVLLGMTPLGNELASRIAQRFRTGLVTGCTSLSLEIEERLLVMGRPLFGGKMIAEYISPKERPQMATVQSGIFIEAFRNEDREGQIERVLFKEEKGK